MILKNFKVGIAASLMTLLAFGSAPSSALVIEVSQESSAGAGDFSANVLGFIDSFSTGLTIADFYDYGTPNGASYNGENNGGPAGISSTTQGFFVEASDGLQYVVVHDRANDSGGGTADMTTLLLGGAGGSAAFTVEDDPGEGTTTTDVGTDREFMTDHGWVSCCTDGYAIGSIAVGDILYAEFDAGPTGITRWQSTSATGADIASVIETDRRVRYRVPEPASVGLIGLGLVGLGMIRRRRVAA